MTDLAHQKDNCLQTTFRGVSKNFRTIFAELVPGGKGELVMQTRRTVSVPVDAITSAKYSQSLLKSKTTEPRKRTNRWFSGMCSLIVPSEPLLSGDLTRSREEG